MRGADYIDAFVHSDGNGNPVQVQVLGINVGKIDRTDAAILMDEVEAFDWEGFEFPADGLDRMYRFACEFDEGWYIGEKPEMLPL